MWCRVRIIYQVLLGCSNEEVLFQGISLSLHSLLISLAMYFFELYSELVTFIQRLHQNLYGEIQASAMRNEDRRRKYLKRKRQFKI